MSVDKDLTRLVVDTVTGVSDGLTGSHYRKRKQYIDLFLLFIKNLKETVTDITVDQSVWSVVEAYKTIMPRDEEVSELIMHVEGHIQKDTSDRGGLNLNVAFAGIASMGGFYERLSASTIRGSVWVTMTFLINTTGGFSVTDLQGFTMPEFEAILSQEKIYLDEVSKKYPVFSIADVVVTPDE